MTATTHSRLDPDHCYQALCAKDSRFDGAFFVGVSTTGIYCRPVCRVRTPRRSSCTFYPNAGAAEAAGFRPCLRCRPELAPYDLQENLAYAIWQRISAGALNNGGSMPDLATRVGLSTRQLQRLMQQHFGVSPVALAQTSRLLFAKKLLQETAMSMTDIAHAAGFGSVRRFNALFADSYGMAPGALRRGVADAQQSSVQASLIRLRMAYRPPFDWDSMLRYLAGRAIGGVEHVADAGEHRTYWRSLRMQVGQHAVQGWMKVSHLPADNQLLIELGSQFAPVLMQLMHRVRQQFDLDANPAVIEAHLHHDALLRQQMARTPGLRVPGAFSTFELAVRAVLGQQVSVAGATTVTARLVRALGDAVDPDTAAPQPALTHHFPTPQQLAVATPDQIAALGMPGSRAATVIALARFAEAGGLDPAPGTTLNDAVSQLKTVKGIGEWTAQYIAMRALRYPDAFPAGDLGLQKAITQAGADRRCTEAQLLQRVAPLSPWRSYAALLLWHSL